MRTTGMRTERDSLGERELPETAPYGAWTDRALENFDLRRAPVSPRLIFSVVLIKKAAALTYERLGVGKPGVCRAVVNACDVLLSFGGDGDRQPDGWPRDGEQIPGFRDLFPLDALQGGAGTSTNMNVNEVVARLAGRLLGEPACVHPLDDVNRGQSTNDVYPTALRIAAIGLLRELSEACARLQQSLQEREAEFDGIRKLGRTELMDAVPITLGQEFGAFAQAIARDRWRLYKVEERLRQVNIGGAAVGLPPAAQRRYRALVLEELRSLTGIGLAAAEYPMDITQNNDVFVEASGLLKALAVNLMKIAGDLRRMNAGPRGGIAEIRLAPVQAGSTIMPGKVNPVIPEMVIQCAMRVMADDACVTMAAASGEFELNAFLPLIADALLGSLSLLNRCVSLFDEKCVRTLEADEERCAENLENSFAFASSYLPALGYDAVAKAVADASGDPAALRSALDEATAASRADS